MSKKSRLKVVEEFIRSWATSEKIDPSQVDALREALRSVSHAITIGRRKEIQKAADTLARKFLAVWTKSND